MKKTLFIALLIVFSTNNSFAMLDLNTAIQKSNEEKINTINDRSL